MYLLKGFVLAASFSLALAVGAHAAEKKAEATAEQKALLKEMTAKYDTNKDGKLDRDERKAMSRDDRKKLREAGLGGKKKNKQDK